MRFRVFVRVIAERVYEVDDVSNAHMARMMVEANPLAFRISREGPGVINVMNVEELRDR